MSNNEQLWLGGILRKRRVAAAMAVGYLAFVTLAHDLMQQPAYWAQAKLTHRSWNALVAIGSLFVLVVIGAVTIRRIVRHPAPRVAIVYLLVPVVLSAVSFHTLMIMNIEVIHFPQYAILAWLLFPLTKRYLDVVLLATAAAFIDEGYQYFVLHGHWGIYFDFNDVLFNTIGAGFGVAFLWVFYPHPKSPPDSLDHRFPNSRYAIPVAAAALLLLCMALTAVGVIAVNPPANPDAWAIVLRRNGPPANFWITTEWGKTYHEMLPWEWIVSTVPVMLFYAFLDRYRAQSGRPKSEGV